jgi:hypothetical protein
MDPNFIATKKDLHELWEKLVSLLDKKFSEVVGNSKSTPKILRSADVRKLLNISDNKLRDMRNNREIPFSRVKNTYFYRESDILNILNEHRREPKQPE